MATFKEVIRKKRADGYYPVYIRIVHRSRMGYIKTDKLITAKQISRNGEIKDAFVNDYCAREILRYTELLNKKDISAYTVKEVVDYLTTPEEDVSFSEFAREHIKRMREEGHDRNAKNYELALNHLERYLGTNRIKCSALTSSVLNCWIESLMTTARAKEMYPTCLRQVFRKALNQFNDEERGIVRIKFDPWKKVKIPESDPTVKLSISAEECREFFSHPLPQSKFVSPIPELGRDVALLSLCLAGINTADLYDLKKENYHDGIIAYKRAKTRDHRKDGAYIEMRVEPYIQTLFEKYLAPKDDEYLFNFHLRHSNRDSFNANVNIGIRKICYDMGMNKDNRYHFYTFRHTWATIAQNDCGASISEVAFGMNHSNKDNVTRGYIKIDFSPAWELNAKVIDFIFYTDKKSKQGKARDPEKRRDILFRITKKMMIYARAYFKGKQVGELTDLGFSNVDQVIKRLALQLPDDIPNGCTVQFRLQNCDTQREIVYERSKGKGF